MVHIIRPALTTLNALGTYDIYYNIYLTDTVDFKNRNIMLFKSVKKLENLIERSS